MPKHGSHSKYRLRVTGSFEFKLSSEDRTSTHLNNQIYLKNIWNGEMLAIQVDRSTMTLDLNLSFSGHCWGKQIKINTCAQMICEVLPTSREQKRNIKND